MLKQLCLNVTAPHIKHLFQGILLTVEKTLSVTTNEPFQLGE